MKKILAALMLAVSVIVSCAPSTVYAQAPAKPDIIEVIDISGEIDANTATVIAATVEKINETPKVKGVLLVVNSPGGGASASAVIYQELAKIKVPVVGFCEYLCASGGVYALMAPSVKYIGVRDEAIGGSVGVIGQITRFNRLLEWAKVDNETFKSGPLKDAGNPTRAGTPEDTKYIQSIIDTLATKFYAVVVKARPKASMDEIKTARIFIGADIVRVGLADAVMTRDQALTKLKELSKSKNAFTRDELRKLTKDASEAASMSGAGVVIRNEASWLDHASTLMGLLKEIHSGESVKFAYRMPYSF